MDGTGRRDVRVEAVEGDITRERVDAIVNAANSSLLGGGGVDGAIHAAAGPALLAECRALRRTSHPTGLPVGEVVATGAGELPATWVVHTVGPNRHAGQADPDLLAACFRRSVELAAHLGARSVAIPAIGAGVYGWDVEEVARIAVGEVRRWVEGGGVDEDRVGGGDRAGGRGHGGGRAAEPTVRVVRFVLFGARAHGAFQEALSR